MHVLLGIDYGSKRIGLAVSDAAGAMAMPLGVVEAKGTLEEQARRVLAAAEGYDVGGFVVGLPLNMDDTEGPQAKASRRFGEALSRAAGRPVTYWDERLSSAAADDLLRPADLTRGKHKARRDSVAALVVLQSYLNAHNPGPEQK